MFVNLGVAAAAALAAAQILPVVVPLGKPQKIERPRAPIEVSGPPSMRMSPARSVMRIEEMPHVPT